MNQRTAKLLNRFAQETGRNYKEVKREWIDMNSAERTTARNAMKVTLHRAEKSSDDS